MTITSSVLQVRDQLPHFDVTTLDGRRVRYETLWQRRNLVLVLVEPGQARAAAAYGSALEARAGEFRDAFTSVVVTAEPVPGMPVPGATVADRWGEILHIAAAPTGAASELPDVDELLAWARFASIQCPECPA